jgi:hypothetical protein
MRKVILLLAVLASPIAHADPNDEACRIVAERAVRIARTGDFTGADAHGTDKVVLDAIRRFRADGTDAETTALIAASFARGRCSGAIDQAAKCRESGARRSAETTTPSLLRAFPFVAG